MRSRLLLGALAAAATLPRLAHAQGSDRLAGGLTSGDYVRASAGVTTPVNPQGSLKDWGSGTGFNVTWENWQPGGNGVGALGVSIGVTYSLLPLKESQFLTDFTPITGGKATTATASKAGMFELATGLRFRIPAPLIVPTINVGFGFINWRPSKISYTGATGNGTTKQQTRNGAELTIGGGLERYFVNRFGVFADASYVYGVTSLGRSSATPGSICASNGCDVLKNTTVTTLRGGLSVKLR